MSRFIHRRDGQITVGALVTVVSEFLIEEPTYSLPPGFRERRYDGASGRHFLFTAEGNQRAGAEPWPEGERYLANEEVYRANIEARKPPPDPPLTGQQKILQRMDFDVTFRTLVRALAPLLNLTVQEFVDLLRTEAQRD
ncbi:MAG: hypothetical protein ACYTAN_01840 [Planctomycetota bacterium]|jgi:hypothetical protein